MSPQQLKPQCCVEDAKRKRQAQGDHELKDRAFKFTRNGHGQHREETTDRSPGKQGRRTEMERR